MDSQGAGADNALGGWREGEVVWAQLGRHPWWPAQVSMTSHHTSKVVSLISYCISYLNVCPYIKLSLLKCTIAVEMQ